MLLAAVPSILGVGLAVAQAAESALPMVVVTSNRFESSPEDDAVRTIVVSAEDIAQSGARTLADVLSIQTGIKFFDTSGNPNQQIDLRGFGMTGDQNTLLLLDGQRITENELASADLTSIPLDAIERIEILRGSGAVLYGRGATGGTINIITQKSSNAKNSAMLGASAGSYGALGAKATANLTVDRLGLVLFAERTDADNYRVNNKLRQENVTASLSYRGDDGPFTLRYSGGQQDLGLPGARTPEQLQNDRRGATYPTDYVKLDTSRLAFGTEQKLGFGFVGLDLTHRARNAEAALYGGAANLTNTRAFSVSPRVRVPFEIASARNSLVVGVDWDRWTWDFRDTVSMNSPSATAVQQNSAVYFRHTVDLPTDTTFSLGAREHHVSTDARDGAYAATQTRQTNAREFSIRQGLTDTLTLNAKAGTSFRLQTVDELRTFGISQLNLLEVQTSKDLDIGLWHQTSYGSFGVTAFEYRIQNEIHLNPYTYANINLPPTRRRGLEFEGRWLASKSVTTDANFTVTDAKFISGTFNGTAVAGNQIPLVPRYKASLSVNWRLDETTRMLVRATHLSESRMDNDELNASAFRRPAYTIVDLMLMVQVDSWRFRAGIQNLFDARYFSYGVISTSSATFNAYPAATRNVLFTAERRF
jgi:iron complex outermembrane receptor protein